MEDKTERAIIRGKQARQIMSDPLIVEAFASVRQQIMDQWAASRPDDQEGRERAYMAMYALERVKDWFAGAIAAGQVSEANLEHANLSQEYNRLNRTPGETL